MTEKYLKEQVDKIRSELAQAEADYYNYGGLSYPSYERQRTLLAYCKKLEEDVAALEMLVAAKQVAIDELKAGTQ